MNINDISKGTTVIIDCKIVVSRKLSQTETFDDVIDKVANMFNVLKGTNANRSPAYQDADIIIGINLEDN